MGLSKFNLHDADTIELAKVAKALAHPARIAIIKYISEQEGCICNDIVDEIGLAQPTISQHLSEIKRIGLLDQTSNGKRICYCINEDKLNDCRRLLSGFFVKTQVSCKR